MIKKTLITLLPALFWCFLIKAQTPWVTVKVDKQISLRFPSAPVKKPAGAYVYVNKDSTAVLILEIHTQGDNDPTESSVIDEFFKNDNEPLGDDVKEIAPKYNTGVWKGYHTITSSAALGNRQICSYTVIINGKAYMLGALLKGDGTSKLKDDFFASITINK